MGDLELDRGDITPDKILKIKSDFIGESSVIVDTVLVILAIYTINLLTQNLTPFTRLGPILLEKELTEDELSKPITPSSDVRKIYNEASVNILKNFSKKILNIIPVYPSVLSGENQTKDCTLDNGAKGNNYCIIRDEHSDIPEKAQLLLLFKNETEVDYEFNIDGVIDKYKLPIDIESESSEKTYITSGYSVKELSSGIGLLVGLRNNLSIINTEYTQEACEQIKQEIKTVHSRSNKLDKKGLLLAWNIIDSIFNNRDKLIYEGEHLTVDRTSVWYTDRA